jgi:acetyl-CoA carboxylase biotin carboxyl carrier protein
MSAKDFTYQDLLQIVDLIKSSSHFAEFHLKLGDIELDLKRGASTPPETKVAAALAARATAGTAAEPSLPVRPAPRAAPLAYPEGAVLIKSPMVGTFYQAPEPGAEPFVKVGDKVEPATIVGIIEVMKLMNSIPAGHQGVVTHILVEDGEPVQYGQVIIVIEPKLAA